MYIATIFATFNDNVECVAMLVPQGYSTEINENMNSNQLASSNSNKTNIKHKLIKLPHI